MSRTIFLKSLIIIMAVTILGIGCKKTPAQNTENTQPQDQISQEAKESYIYDQINQIIGDKELAQKMTETQPTTDELQIAVKGIERGIMMASVEYKNDARLDDVTGGKASGVLRSGYKNGEYALYTSFAGLMDPINDDYYEGWLVRREPFDYISTGRIEKIGGLYNNLYKTTKDLSKYDLYVLTLETNDNNSTPAKHILEGIIKQIKKR